jgi:ribose transport system substrate-binding protein
MKRRIVSSQLAILAAAALAACGGEESTAGPSGGGGNGAGGGPPSTNQFFPQDLEDAAAKLTEALGEQSDPGSIKVAVVANRHSNYWTPAQIGTGRASSSIGCYASFDATSDGEVASQIAILDRQVDEGFAGISVSAIDAVQIEPAIENAVSNDVNVITFDSDAAAGSKRALYLGTINYEAGKAAGAKMVDLLGPAGGEVAAFAGLSTAANAQERIQGIKDAFKGTKASLVESYFDEIDFDLARVNVETALSDHASLAGIIGVYAYNGPIALDVLEDQNKVGSLRLVAFDLDPGTLDGLAAGKVDAAIGQRPYWMGYLSVHLLYSMKVLGVEKTKSLLEPWLSGSGSIFSTGQDIVTPDTIQDYNDYLASLGISSS